MNCWLNIVHTEIQMQLLRWSYLPVMEAGLASRKVVLEAEPPCIRLERERERTFMPNYIHKASGKYYQSSWPQLVIKSHATVSYRVLHTISLLAHDQKNNVTTLTVHSDPKSAYDLRCAVCPWIAARGCIPTGGWGSPGDAGRGWVEERVTLLDLRGEEVPIPTCIGRATCFMVWDRVLPRIRASNTLEMRYGNMKYMYGSVEYGSMGVWEYGSGIGWQHHYF